MQVRSERSLGRLAQVGRELVAHHHEARDHLRDLRVRLHLAGQHTIAGHCAHYREHAHALCGGSIRLVVADHHDRNLIRQQPSQPLELHLGAAHLRVDVIGIVSSAVLCGCGHGRLRGVKRKTQDCEKTLQWGDQKVDTGKVARFGSDQKRFPCFDSRGQDVH